MGRARVGKIQEYYTTVHVRARVHKLRARTVISEEGKHRSLVERRNDRVDLGADLDFIDETVRQFRRERRCAGLRAEQSAENGAGVHVLAAAVRVREQSAPDVSSAVLRGRKDVRDALLEVSAHHRRLARHAHV